MCTFLDFLGFDRISKIDRSVRIIQEITLFLLILSTKSVLWGYSKSGHIFRSKVVLPHFFMEISDSLTTKFRGELTSKDIG